MIDYKTKCKRLRTDGPTPCLCCPDECVGNDPREAATLDDASANGDGTYNGMRALSWLSEVMNPGKGVSEAEVQAMWKSVKAKKAARK